eukprot:6160231-Amphidinium_carterae.1
MAEALQSKGTVHPWSERDKAIKILRESKGVDVLPEVTAPDDHQANGLAESAVKDVKAQFRVLKLAIEEDYNVTLGKEHQIIPWVVRAASSALTRGSVGRDGKTPYERLHGHRYRRQLPPLAETVMYKLRDHDASRAEPRWEK